MSNELYDCGKLRLWTEDEIQLRELFCIRVTSVIKRCLISRNNAWLFEECEGSILIPLSYINCSYDSNDVFYTDYYINNERVCLRPETTASSYFLAKNRTKLPVCIYQKGKSFRKEDNDGASGSKLRFNEFWQLEFQCIYSENTKADYRSDLIEVVKIEISRFTGLESRVVESDRLPSYSDSTIDIEVKCGEKWIEIASCSIRNDFSETIKVCEIAIGLDRVSALSSKFGS